MNTRRVVAILLAVLLGATVSSLAQLYDGNQTLIPFGSYAGSDFDVVSLQNGNLHVRIPTATIVQRGKPVEWFFIFDTPAFPRVWVSQPTPTNPRAGSYYVRTPDPGFRQRSSYDWKARLSGPGSTTTCGTQLYTVYTNYAVDDPEGGSHPLNLKTGNVGVQVCGQLNSSPTLDGSGMWANYDYTTGNISVALKDGTQVGNGATEDTNGNMGSKSADTLNRASVTVTQPANVAYTTPSGKTSYGPPYTIVNVVDASGTMQPYRVDYVGIDSQPDFCGNLPFCHNLSPTSVVPKTIMLPTQLKYTFSWFGESTSTVAGSGLELKQIILPTGGSISYTYGNSCILQPGVSGNPPSTCRRAVATRTVTADGRTDVWTYNGGTVTDPAGNDQVHVWSVINDGNGHTSASSVEKEVDYYAGSAATGRLLKKVTTDYASEFDGQFYSNIRPIRVTTTLDDNSVSKAETDYETFTYNGTAIATRLNPTERREYDYGSGAPPSTPIRRTTFTYLHNQSTSYRTPNIVDRVLVTTVYDGSGTMIARTTNEYDNYAVDTHHASLSTTGAVRHDSAYNGNSYQLRGNVTAVTRWLSAGSPVSYVEYDDTGNAIEKIDPLGHVTTISFNDLWSRSGCAVGTSTFAYPTLIKDALQHRIQHTYEPCTGLLMKSQDENDLVASRNGTTYTYNDPVRRQTDVFFADGGHKHFDYLDSALTVNESDKLDKSYDDSAHNLRTSQIFGNLGQRIQAQLVSDPAGKDLTDYAYDAFGRSLAVSNPHRAASLPTDGTVYHYYDALGRPCKDVLQDGSISSPDCTGTGTNLVTHTYSGRCVTVKDPAGKQRKSCSDALGRVTGVWEDPTGVNYETDYAYDVLDDLARVNQKGSAPTDSTQWRTRTFVYDSLSRLVCAANPEIGVSLVACPSPDNGTYTQGTVRYSYDRDGDVLTKISPAPNQTSTATVTTSYSYDALNRKTSETFSDGTYRGNWHYDQGTSDLGNTVMNPFGRLTSSSQTNGAKDYSYDEVGRVLTVHEASDTPTREIYPISYAYDVSGNMISLTYPSGRSLAYTYDTAGHAASVYDPAVTYANSFTYWPNGTQFEYHTPATHTQSDLNSRLQIVHLGVDNGTVAGYYLDKTYNYDAGNNGNVHSITNNKNDARTQTFSYDSLNRILSANSQANTGIYSWGENYSIDAWGNLQISPMSGKAQGGYFQLAGDGHNRASTLNYDAAGNLRNPNGPTTFTFDAGNLQKTDGGYTYYYDADGKRFQRWQSGTCQNLYWYGDGSNPVAEGSASALSAEYIFVNGNRIARVDLPAGTIHFYFEDHLKSTSMVISNSTKQIEEESDYHPYGYEVAITGPAAVPNHYKFTGKERDAESGLDNFGFRYYGSSMGRFMTPDLDNDPDEPGPMPFADFRDPQTLNLYAYVRNNPLNRVDPDGHKQVCTSSSESDIQGNIKMTVTCHDEPDPPPPSIIDQIRAFFGTEDPEAKRAIGFGVIRDIMTGRSNAGNLNDLLPNTATNSTNPAPPTIPLKVLKTLDSILNTGNNLPNQAGGQEFRNDNKNLPNIDQNGNPITYWKWDVDASKFEGNPRNAERLVTGSDGSAWYTNDKYKNFTRIK